MELKATPRNGIGFPKRNLWAEGRGSLGRKDKWDLGRKGLGRKGLGRKDEWDRWVVAKSGSSRVVRVRDGLVKRVLRLLIEDTAGDSVQVGSADGEESGEEGRTHPRTQECLDRRLRARPLE